MGGIFSVAVFNYLLNLLIHRHMKRYISRSHFSSINYKQQQRLTWLLVGQGSLPLLLVALVIIITSIGLPDLMKNKPLPKDVWESCLIAIALYPLLGPILTILLTKPYYEAFKSIFIYRLSRNKNGVSVIKF